jgi:hypothetical protein
VQASPPYDNTGETAALAASDLVFEMISIMVKHSGFEDPKVDITKPRLPKININWKGDRVEL